MKNQVKIFSHLIITKKMFQAICCRLCINICSDHKSLYNEDGQTNESYKLAAKYFSPEFLDVEWVKHLRNICLKCWNHIAEFHEFQQSVILAQKIAVFNKLTETADKLKVVTDNLSSTSRICQSGEWLSSMIVNKANNKEDLNTLQEYEAEEYLIYDDEAEFSEEQRMEIKNSAASSELQQTSQVNFRLEETSKSARSLTLVDPKGKQFSYADNNRKALSIDKSMPKSCTKVSTNDSGKQVHFTLLKDSDQKLDLYVESENEPMEVIVLEDFPKKISDHPELSANSTDSQDEDLVSIYDYESSKSEEDCDQIIELGSPEPPSPKKKFNFLDFLKLEALSDLDDDILEDLATENDITRDQEVATQSNPNLWKTLARSFESPGNSINVNKEYHQSDISTGHTVKHKTQSNSFSSFEKENQKDKKSRPKVISQLSALPGTSSAKRTVATKIISYMEAPSPEEIASEPCKQSTQQMVSKSPMKEESLATMIALSSQNEISQEPETISIKLEEEESFNLSDAEVIMLENDLIRQIQIAKSTSKQNLESRNVTVPTTASNQQKGNLLMLTDSSKPLRTEVLPNAAKQQPLIMEEGAENMATKYSSSNLKTFERRLKQIKTVSYSKTNWIETTSIANKSFLDGEQEESNSNFNQPPEQDELLMEREYISDDSNNSNGLLQTDHQTDNSDWEDFNENQSSDDDDDDWQESPDRKTTQRKQVARKTISYKRITEFGPPKTIDDYDQLIADWRPHLQCVLCPEMKTKFSLLLQHFKEKHPTKKCYILCCQHKLFYRYEIARHIQYHNDHSLYTYKCELCYRSFRKNCYLRDHMKVKHSVKPPTSKFNCHKCDASFIEKCGLVRHLKYSCDNGQRNKERTHHCKICGKSYKLRSTLDNHHKVVHLGLKKPPEIKCQICDKTFIAAMHLREHMNSHTKERTAVCQHCPKTYLYYTDLIRHMKKHHFTEWLEKARIRMEYRRNRKRVYKKKSSSRQEKSDEEENKKQESSQQESKEEENSRSESQEQEYQSMEQEGREEGSQQQESIESLSLEKADQGVFPCDICSRSFKYSAYLTAHKRRHFKAVKDSSQD
ncbi:uncharacterized protein LOC106084568 isoform X1 [Stomoxys calcitrans]|uniref:uncharacterized protein LOC106084568 isoform X1 n=1 Tax=Stomoxys calcitrans TaxID=35570 RepID=UPI0027E34069|nr:uncharacterized protein LOC106084568 isoform X1 [Stomoxys calcitrans]